MVPAEGSLCRSCAPADTWARGGCRLRPPALAPSPAQPVPRSCRNWSSCRRRSDPATRQPPHGRSANLLRAQPDAPCTSCRFPQQSVFPSIPWTRSRPHFGAVVSVFVVPPSTLTLSSRLWKIKASPVTFPRVGSVILGGVAMVAVSTYSPVSLVYTSCPPVPRPPPEFNTTWPRAVRPSTCACPP